jgi:hypothetical protein
MARKRYKPEEIVAKLRQVDVLVSQGQSMADAIRQRCRCHKGHTAGGVPRQNPTKRTEVTQKIWRK